VAAVPSGPNGTPPPTIQIKKINEHSWIMGKRIKIENM
jgi:hypothetical protein